MSQSLSNEDKRYLEFEFSLLSCRQEKSKEE